MVKLTVLYQPQVSGGVNLECEINVSAEKIFWSKCIGIWAEVGAKVLPLISTRQNKIGFPRFCLFMDASWHHHEIFPLVEELSHNLFCLSNPYMW